VEYAAAPADEGKRRPSTSHDAGGQSGGVSWLTMARVIRGQVLSLKTAISRGGAGDREASARIFRGTSGEPMGRSSSRDVPVPQGSCKSVPEFHGVGVKPPLPRWGNLAADGLERSTRTEQTGCCCFPVFFAGTTFGVELVGRRFPQSWAAAVDADPGGN